MNPPKSRQSLSNLTSIFLRGGPMILLRRSSRYTVLGLLFSVMGVLTLLSFPGRGITQDAAKATRPSGASATQDDVGFVGVETCQRCHSVGLDKPRVITLPLGKSKLAADDGWVREDEYSTWVQRGDKNSDSWDKHSQAYAVLSLRQAQQMAKIMGVDVAHYPRCVACHSGFPLPNDVAQLDKSFVQRYEVSYGITCEGCHGGAAQRRKPAGGWLSPHWIPPSEAKLKTAWRYLSSKTKESDFGFVDVRSPVAKATLCVSCHVGDVSRGRILTHEMYAAGHPLLSGFEVETFSDQMPKHWRPISEKPPEVRKNYANLARDSFFKDDLKQPRPLIRTKGLMVGSLVTLGASLKLTSALSDNKQTQNPLAGTRAIRVLRLPSRFEEGQLAHCVGNRPALPGDRCCGNGLSPSRGSQ